MDCKNITKLELNNIKEIEHESFDSCDNLKEVKLNDSITCLKYYTFKSCKSLKKIHLPTSLKRIESCCFMNCESLEHIDIPDGVTYIGIGCFDGCSKLKELVIKNKNCQINEEIIVNCHSLTKLEIPLINGIYPNCIRLKKEKTILDKIGIKNIYIEEILKFHNHHLSLEIVNADNYYEIQELVQNYKTTSLYIPSTMTSFNFY